MEFVILSFWLMLILLILGLVYSVWQNHQQTSPDKQQHKHTLNFKITSPSRDRNINSRKWQKLLKLVHGDVATANRLIEYEHRRNPERSLDWCIDKALWQLQRDRR